MGFLHYLQTCNYLFCGKDIQWRAALATITTLGILIIQLVYKQLFPTKAKGNTHMSTSNSGIQSIAGSSISQIGQVGTININTSKEEVKAVAKGAKKSKSEKKCRFGIEIKGSYRQEVIFTFYDDTEEKYRLTTTFIQLSDVLARVESILTEEGIPHDRVQKRHLTQDFYYSNLYITKKKMFIKKYHLALITRD